jgi:hypothetical protein
LALGNHGFLYNGTAFTTIDHPLGLDTVIFGIDGNTLVGAYSDSSGVFHGFQAVIPEPSSLILLGIGGVALCVFSWRQRRQRAE